MAPPDDTLERALEELRKRVLLAPFTRTELDRRLGKTRGHVSALLRQSRKLTFLQLIELLDALNADPIEFFTAVFAPRPSPRLRPPTTTASMVELSSTSPYATLPSPDPVPPAPPDDLKQLILEAVRQALAEVKQPPAPPAGSTKDT